MAKHWRRLVLQRLVAGLLVVALGLTACSDRPFSQRPTKLSRTPSKRFVKEIVEVPPPTSIQQLRSEMDVYQPQVKILTPQMEELIDDTRVEVQLDVKDLPLFKEEDLGLGPHLHLILDNQPYQAVYSTQEPIVFEDLEPGTHTLRVFASRPWHESFKNAGAYDQVKFYIFTNTPNNDADLQQPLITYSRPKGQYGAEPIMLDFYLTNTPLHVIAQEDPEDDLLDWQIRGTVNGQSFTFDTWEPIYLTGFEPGLNWIKLELLDEDGELFNNAFNGTARIVYFQPEGDDSLSRLVRGEIADTQLPKIIDPDYSPPTAPAKAEGTERSLEAAPENQPEPEAAPELELEPEGESETEPGEQPADADKPEGELGEPAAEVEGDRPSERSSELEGQPQSTEPQPTSNEDDEGEVGSNQSVETKPDRSPPSLEPAAPESADVDQPQEPKSQTPEPQVTDTSSEPDRPKASSASQPEQIEKPKSSSEPAQSPSDSEALSPESMPDDGSEDVETPSPMTP